MLRRISVWIDALNALTGRIVAWGILAMVILQALVVIARYVFSTSDLFGLPAVWLQEGVVYLHGLTIMLGAGYALLYDRHVRVDVFRSHASERARDLTDLFGTLLFILPLCWLVIWSSLPSLRISWMTLEGSIEPNGLPFRYLLKSTVLVFAVLLGLQAVSVALKAGLRLSGLSRAPVFREDPQR